MKRNDIIRDVAVGKIATQFCLTLIVKELKISVEHGRVVTTLNIILCVVNGSYQLLAPIWPMRATTCK